MLTDLNIKLPVGTADAGSFFNNEVLAAVDYGMSNVHPWFANVSIDQAAGWTADFFQENNVVVAQSLPNKPEMFIAETGWPSESSDAGNENNGPSIASVPNLQKFLDTFVCQANQNGTGYFYFEVRSFLACPKIRAHPAVSSSMRRGRTSSSVVLKVTGVFTTPSTCLVGSTHPR